MTDSGDAKPQETDGLPDRYEVLGLLGTGGMGRVLHARDRVLDREVAVKVLTPFCALDEAYTRRFLNEARAAARLNHPNIVQIYEFGNEDGCAYLVMEYVDGPSLKAAMSRNGPYPEPRAAELIGEACLALGAAHEQGIMHRDVKPDNMMLTSSGRFKLVDLGLAKAEDCTSDQTMTGSTMGTPHYISPEQILGAKEVDRRADIYSLGASLFCLATGKAPYEGTSGAHIMSRHLNDPLPDPRVLVPGLSADFCRTVGKAMAKDPDHRYQDTRELKEDLDRVRAAAAAGPADVSSAFAGPEDRTIAMMQTPSGATYCPTFQPPCDNEDLERMESALTLAIGPLAPLLVGKESRRADTREALVESLAAHIPDRQDRRKFLKRFGVGDTGSRSLSRDLSRSGARSFAEPAAVLSDEVLAGLKQCLALRIGPLAAVLVKREAAAGGGFVAVSERLAAQVPDESERRAFRAEIRHLDPS